MLNNDANFARFRIIQPELKLSSIWTKLDKDSAHTISLVARLWMLIPQANNPVPCLLCGRFTYDINKHIVSACAGFSTERECFIYHITNDINAHIGHFMRHADFESLHCSLLGAKIHRSLECDYIIYDGFFCRAIAFVSQLVISHVLSLLFQYYCIIFR